MITTQRQPWDPDFVLHNEAVEHLARTCGLRGAIAPLGSGWDYFTFLCDGIVIRIPKRAETAVLLNAELALLARLPERLPLAVPKPRAALERSEYLPYAAMLYPLLEGTPLCDCLSVLGGNAAAIGAQIGLFLSEVHHVIAPTQSDDHELAHWHSFCHERLDGIGPTLSHDERRAAHRIIDQVPPPDEAARVLCHLDLTDGHVLIDVVGKATGVIDWGDAGTAPWWRDFTGIWMWGGDLALDAALRSYGKTLTQNERHWLYHHALLATVNDLEYNEALNLSAEVLHESSRRFRRALRALQRFASPGF